MSAQEIAARRRPPRLATGLVTCLLLVVMLVMVPGCMSHYHTAGAGPTGGEIRYEKQWWAFWGLLPFGGAPNSKEYAGDRVNYEVWTGIGTWDFMLNMLIFPFGFYRSSITLEF